MITDQQAMTFALAEARNALAHDDVPVGAVVIHNDVIIASRHNERELRNDPTAHAEVLALRDAANLLGRWLIRESAKLFSVRPI
jgi:tRNA(adenine34) deaminase